jgi:hypothetical protein
MSTAPGTFPQPPQKVTMKTTASRRARRRDTSASTVPTYPIIHRPPPERHAWALLRSDWLDDVSPWEARVEERRVARGRLTKALTRLSDDAVVHLLRKDRELSLVATRFGRPFVVPGALESFLHEVHRARREQAEAVARLDAYDALLVGSRRTPPPTPKRLDSPTLARS